MERTYITCGVCTRQMETTPYGDRPLAEIMAGVGWVLVDDRIVCLSCKPTPQNTHRMCDICGVAVATTERIIGKGTRVEWLCGGCSDAISKALSS